jgi:hypothetical protein
MTLVCIRAFLCPPTKAKPLRELNDEPATVEDLQKHLGKEVRLQSKAARDATEFGARKISTETNENEDD